MYIVINGGGKIAEYLATTMLNKGHDVAVIEKREVAAQHLAEVLPTRALVICGDGCDSVYQSDAGVAHADVFVATTGNDDDNLVSCEIADIVFKVPRAIARINNPKNERIFRMSGIESVSSTSIIAHIIEEEAFAGDIRVVSSLRKGDLTMCEAELTDKGLFADSAGRRVADITLPDGSLLVAVARKDDDIIETVSGDTRLFAGDTVIALVKKDSEKALRQVLRK